MRALLQTKGILLVWVIITATAGLAKQMRDVALELRKATPDLVKNVNSVFDTVNKFASTTTEAFFKSVQFNPTTPVIDIRGMTSIRTRDFMLLVGILFLLFLIFLYQRAVKSDAFADDLIALVFLYFFVIVVLSIILGLGFGIQAANQRGFVLGFFLLLILMLGMRAGMVEDSRIFFRGLTESVLLTLFLYPEPTIGALASGIDGLAGVGESLNKNVSMFLFWSLVGFLLAVGELYALSIRRKPAAPAPKPKAEAKASGGPGA